MTEKHVKHERNCTIPFFPFRFLQARSTFARRPRRLPCDPLARAPLRPAEHKVRPARSGSRDGKGSAWWPGRPKSKNWGNQSGLEKSWNDLWKTEARKAIKHRNKYTLQNKCLGVLQPRPNMIFQGFKARLQLRKYGPQRVIASLSVKSKGMSTSDFFEYQRFKTKPFLRAQARKTKKDMFFLLLKNSLILCLSCRWCRSLRPCSYCRRHQRPVSRRQSAPSDGCLGNARNAATPQRQASRKWPQLFILYIAFLQMGLSPKALKKPSHRILPEARTTTLQEAVAANLWCFTINLGKDLDKFIYILFVEFFKACNSSS